MAQRFRSEEPLKSQNKKIVSIVSALLFAKAQYKTPEDVVAKIKECSSFLQVEPGYQVSGDDEEFFAVYVGKMYRDPIAEDHIMTYEKLGIQVVISFYSFTVKDLPSSQSTIARSVQKLFIMEPVIRPYERCEKCKNYYRNILKHKICRPNQRKEWTENNPEKYLAFRIRQTQERHEKKMDKIRANRIEL